MKEQIKRIRGMKHQRIKESMLQELQPEVMHGLLLMKESLIDLLQSDFLRT